MCVHTERILTMCVLQIQTPRKPLLNSSATLHSKLSTSATPGVLGRDIPEVHGHQHPQRLIWIHKVAVRGGFSPRNLSTSYGKPAEQHRRSSSLPLALGVSLLRPLCSPGIPRSPS